MNVKLMTDVDLKGKKVVLREDLNVPLKNGVVTSDARLKAALPAIQHALDKGAAVILLSHLGRPDEGVFAEEFSLAPVAKRLGELLGAPVPLVGDYLNGVDIKPGQVVLCENIRFQPGENKNKPELSAKLAALGDVYVMDAFATAHRANASTEGAIRQAKIACCGPLMAQELDALSRILEQPAHPLLAIIGGSKVSTKLTVLDNLIKRVDRMIVGGGIANTFLAAAGYNVGKSLMEADLLPEAKRIMADAKARNADIPLPVDAVVASELREGAPTRICAVAEVGPEDMILDVGPKTAALFAGVIAQAGTIVWNGPVGAFEIDAFGQGTQSVAKAVAQAKGFSVLGGGDSIAAVEKYGVDDQINYISTAGGAFLEMLEGKELPAVAALQARA
ncbi:MAG: phosphoglycerate kinase [Deltaproteobacteria bacterium]|jgi:phosphoglycerate kinase|nr:phosphoglycerate kinase [Deltaproteobacteria bacterium]